MNSYNENVRSTITTVLSNLEAENKRHSAELDLAKQKHSLAVSTEKIAEEKLDHSSELFQYQSEIQSRVVECADSAEIIHQSTDEYKTLATRLVTNSAVAASKVQVAVTAVFQVAGDAANVFSIVSASDFDTEIYKLAEKTNDCLRNTAETAGIASQQALELSVQAAQTAATTASSQAKMVLGGAIAFRDTREASVAALKAVVGMDTDNLEVAQSDEKTAKGEVETSRLAHATAQRAFRECTEELNFGLTVSQGKRTKNSFTVQFNRYTLPFTAEKNPVKGYFLFLVKAHSAPNFSLTNAENALTHPEHYVWIPAVATKKQYERVVDSGELRDSHGDEMVPGKPYVVFLLVEPSETYKKEINCFDNYLLAPSETFSLAGEEGNSNANETEHQLSESLTERIAEQIQELKSEIRLEEQLLALHQMEVDVLTNRVTRYQEKAEANFKGKEQLESENDQLLALIGFVQSFSNTMTYDVNRATEATAAANRLASETKLLTDKLLYSVAIVNKLERIIVRKKGFNPLILDDLVKLAGKTVTDADKAMTLTLDALSAVFMAQAGSLETKDAEEATLNVLLELQAKLGKILDDPTNQDTLKAWFEKAIKLATVQWKISQRSEKEVTKHLNAAQVNLNAVQVRLKSLQAGLAAVEAAAGR